MPAQGSCMVAIDHCHNAHNRRSCRALPACVWVDHQQGPYMSGGVSVGMSIAGSLSSGAPSASFAFDDDAHGRCQHMAHASCSAARSAAGCLASRDPAGWSHCTWVDAVR